MISQKQKLHNLSRQIKTSIESFTQQQITIVQNIINAMFAHCYLNGNITNNQIYQLFQKAMEKYSLNIQNNKIVFQTAEVFSHPDYYAKIYSLFLDKILSYFSTNNVNDADYNDVSLLINDEKLNKYTLLLNDKQDNKEIQIAQQRDNIVKQTILNNVILSDINQIEFYQGEEKTMNKVQAKFIIGTKQDQIRSSDTTTLVDVQTRNEIIREIESESLNKLYE